MLRDCKYRLPCAWCDKYDRPCEAVEYELLKQQEEITKKLKSEECEHEWKYEGQLGNRHHYRCVKCDTLKAVPLENIYSSTT